MKTTKYYLIIIVQLIFLIGCNDSDNQSTDIDSGDNPNTDTGNPIQSLENIVTIEDIISMNMDSHEADGDYIYDDSNIIEIQLNEDYITVNGTGVIIDGSIATITNAGKYRISGTLLDGQIIVDSDDAEKIQLLFNNININCSYNAPIYIKSSEKTIIILEENTENYISDGETYEEGEEDANAALFSKDNLSISGEGSLNVTANYNDGITSKDGLIINSGNINVTSVDDGIRGKDYIIINNATLNLNVEGDGLKSDEDEEDDKGYITIYDINATIIAQGDAIQAETNILINYGEFILTSGGGSLANLAEDDSAKAIKAGTNIAIEAGNFIINAADDGVHSNNSIYIYNGNFEIETGDDGIHSDEVLQIDDGTIIVNKSYEGVESATILINNGNLHLTSTDDGLNVAGDSLNNYYLYINDGYIVIDAAGDGIDVNGFIEMYGGTVIVNGPTSDMNGAIDYDRTFNMYGGFIVAVGSSRMAQTISSSSSQYGVLAKFSRQSAEQMINVQTTTGKTIFSFVPKKTYQSIAFSSPDLQKNTTYSIYLEGSSTGLDTDGLYLDGTYTKGNLLTNFTISNTVTNVN